MNIHELLANPPGIHGPKDSPTNRYRIEDALFYFLDDYLRPMMKTLEVGAGSSTIIFALQHTWHTCIVPDAQQVQRIREFCELKQISLEQVRFIVQSSTQALPAIDEPASYDCVLIDGGHGFPVPFLDWYYSAGLLKIGGIVIVDDLHIWTCSVLSDFLRESPAWSLVKETSRASIYRKLQDGSQNQEWSHQNSPFAYFEKRSKVSPHFVCETDALRRSFHHMEG